MKPIQWTEEDDQQLETLMQEFDHRERMKDTPARDMMPAETWDAVMTAYSLQLRWALKAAIIVAALKGEGLGLWQRDIDGLREVHEGITQGMDDHPVWESTSPEGWYRAIPRHVMAAFEDDQFDVHTEAICRVLGLTFEPCERRAV